MAKRFIVLLAAIASAALTWACLRDNTRGIDIGQLASTLATVGVTLMGFSMAALSILAAAPDQKLVRNLRRTGHWGNLLDDLFYTTVLFLLDLVLAFGTMLVAGPNEVWWATATVLVFSIAVGTLVLGGQNFYHVIGKLHEAPPGPLE